MSFTSNIKYELCKVENKKACCMHAECYGIWLFSKLFSQRENTYLSENGAVVRRMAELAAAAAGVTAEVSFAVSRRKKPAYKIILPGEQTRQGLFFAFGHTGLETALRINRANFEDECCYAAFLRGAFLVCGMMTDPQKEYHIEFNVQYKHLSNDFYTLMTEVETRALSPLLARRKGNFIVYLKDSAQIEDLLTYMGAPGASMTLMQIKMYKEMKNDINRKANFETANMDKTYSASARQTAAIARISDEIGIGSLPDELQDIARLRLENPEMTLRELAEELKLTRGAANHRMKKILAIGEKLQGLSVPEPDRNINNRSTEE